MKPSIIIHGKNNLSPEELDKLAEFYGMKKWSLTALHTVEPRKRNGWLIFNISKVEFESDLELIPLESAIHDYNAAIPLTSWAGGSPPSVGEYCASINSTPRIRRWFDGKEWSVPWFVGDPQSKADSQAGQLRVSNLPIQWRGLSKPPIILKESK